MTGDTWNSVLAGCNFVLTFGGLIVIFASPLFLKVYNCRSLRERRELKALRQERKRLKWAYIVARPELNDAAYQARRGTVGMLEDAAQKVYGE